MELTFAHKLEIAFVLIVLTASGIFFFRGTRPIDDRTINGWTLPRPVPVDPNKPISASNPIDPKRSPNVTTFVFFDGTLEIAEYPPESGKRAVLSFKPDQRRDHYQIYKNPLDKIEHISDPYKRTLSVAAYSAADDHPRGMLVGAKMTAEQLKTEAEQRQAMLDQVALVTEGTKTGTFSPDDYEKILAALDKYRLIDTDPSKDPAKAKLAYDVVELTLGYLEKAQESKAENIEAYISKIDQLLLDDQKVKLGEYGKQLGKQVAVERRPRRTFKAG